MLLTIIILFSLIMTTLMFFLGNPWWALILEFLGFTLLGFLLFFLFAWIVLLVLKPRKEEEMPKKLFSLVNYYACEFVLFFMRIKVIYEGKELLDNKRVVFMASNHQSILDPLIIIKTTKMKSLAVLMKKEVKNIPLVGRWLHESGFYFLDRENTREAVKPILYSINAIKNGRTMGAFVEGTRSKGPNIGDFKDGVFKIPLKANAPILVITVDNCYKIHKHFPWRKTVVLLKVCKVIEYEEYKGKQTWEIAADVKKIMNDALVESRNKYQILNKD